MAYLLPADYVNYGLPPGTTPDWIAAATALINSYCRRADLNVIDYDRLNVHKPEVRYDLPARGRRLVQRTEGYDATIVAGVPVHLHGEPTGALPGRLVRKPNG